MSSCRPDFAGLGSVFLSGILPFFDPWILRFFDSSMLRVFDPAIPGFFDPLSLVNPDQTFVKFIRYKNANESRVYIERITVFPRY